MFIFQCLPLVSAFAFFPPPFLTLSFSLSLSLSLSCSFLSSFLACYSVASLFLLPCLFVCLVCLFCFMRRTTSKYHVRKLFSSIFSVLGFLSCFVFEIPFSYLRLFFLILSCVIWSTSMFICFKQDNLQSTNIWSSWGLQQNVFFNNLCLQNVKSYRFWGPLLGKFLLMFTEHCKNRYFSTFLKAKNAKQIPF